MQSSGGCVVLWLAAVWCACSPCLALPAHQQPSTPTHTRNTLLALVQAATAIHNNHPQPSHHTHTHFLLQYPHLFRRQHGAAAAPPPDLPPSGPQLLPAHRAHLQQEPEGEEVRLPWSKRGEESEVGATAVNSGEEQQQEQQQPQQEQQQEVVSAGLQQVGASIANNFLRHARSGPRPYDVPRIDCPAAEDQMERFPCPSPDRMGRYRCIDDHVLCDGFIDCPDGEDEDRQQCMFYKTTKAHLDVLADAIIRWARGGK